jgi:hypothetical protein
LIVGEKRATYADAFTIAVLGTLLESLCFLFIPLRIVALPLLIIIWLALIKNFHETGWIGSIAIAILAVLLFLIIDLVLATVLAITEIIPESWLFPDASGLKALR